MAKQKPNATASAPSKSTFAESLLTISSRFTLAKVFDDFLTMAIAAVTQNLLTRKSWYEDEYLATIAYYKDSDLRHEFPRAFAYLVAEMEERTESSLGNDVLGDFFERHISNGRNGQFFTPFPVCKFMASITNTDAVLDAEINNRPLRILDPACGSGRMLLAAHQTNGQGHEYYGIDIDRICVKMAAINLFLNGMWGSEVMCANALSPDDFVISYRISFLPLGIFKIEDKEQSTLWHMHKNSFPVKQEKKTGESITLDETPFAERPKDNPTQLYLF